MKTISVIFIILFLTSGATMQSGGGFEITEAAVAAGGDPSAADGFEVDATLAQSTADGLIGSGNFAITSGFWNYTALAPTAAPASISGRVLNQTGTGITNVILYAQTASGEIFMTRSSPFGYYMFEGIEVGQNVFITVEHKRFTFEPRSVMIADNVTDLDFVAQ